MGPKSPVRHPIFNTRHRNNNKHISKTYFYPSLEWSTMIGCNKSFDKFKPIKVFYFMGPRVVMAQRNLFMTSSPGMNLNCLICACPKCVYCKSN